MIGLSARIAITAALAGAIILPTAAPASAIDSIEFGNLPPSQLADVNRPSFDTRILVPETAPRTCPRRVRSKLNLAGVNAPKLCRSAVRHAPNKRARAAIKYVFEHLGAPYAHKGIGRDSVQPYIFDCSSLIGRAYNAAGAVIRSKTVGYSVPFYPLLSYTGAYVRSNYGGTNLVRVSPKHLRPGDFTIQFHGPNPSQSGGGDGHAQLYLGNGIVAQSTPYGPDAVSLWPMHNGFPNAWFFRVRNVRPRTPTPIVADTGVTFYSGASYVGSKWSQVSALQAALLQTPYATPELVTSGATQKYDQPTLDSVQALQLSMGYPAERATGLLDAYSATRLGFTWATG